MDSKIYLKSKEDIKKMTEGGKLLKSVKLKLLSSVKEDVSAYEIENLADSLITALGGRPSFKMVPGYHWATCINVNEGLVHGIPRKDVIFKKCDVVSVDVGLFYEGFHTDTSFTVGISARSEVKKFIEKGKMSLNKAVGEATPGKKIYDVSHAIESTLVNEGYSPIRALVGHGVGRNLHEAPQIPCFISGDRKTSLDIVAGMVLAIEVMYAMGSPDVILAPDGWTISMRDGKISALFEETVAVTEDGPSVLT